MDKNIKAVIFDLDGVIVDTARFHYIAWKQLADQLGFDFTLGHNELLKGIGRLESLDILLSIGKINASVEQKNMWAQQKNAAYIALCNQMKTGDVLPGVLDFLEDLRINDIKIALGSASKNAPLILEHTGITPYFDAIVDGNSISRGKPDPQVFLLGAEELGVFPSECIVFEDALAGIQAAKTAGMTAIGVGSPENLPGADSYINGFKDLKWKNIVSVVNVA